MAATLLLFSVAASASPLGDPDSGSPGDEESTTTSIIMVAGAASIVLGLILYDVFSDAAREAESDSTAATVEDTGVDWEALPVAESGQQEASEESRTELLIVLQALPGPDGTAASDQLAEELGLALAGTRYRVQPNSVSIGSEYTPEEMARMTADFFSSDLFLALRRTSDGGLEAILLDDGGEPLAEGAFDEPAAEQISNLVLEATEAQAQ